jgi:hypothetical protein
MNQWMRSVLAIVAIVIIALALSASSNGAKLVQAGLWIAIIVVVLKNTHTVTNESGQTVASGPIIDATKYLTRVVSQTPAQQGSS